MFRSRLIASPSVEAAWGTTAPRWSGGRHIVGSSLVLALGAFAFGSFVYLNLTPLRFRGSAAVEITTKEPTLRAALTQAAIEGATSKPVLLRAAAALSNMPAPRPDIFESMAVTLGIKGSHPTGRDGRLANRLSNEVDVRKGELPATIDIAIRDPDAKTAAQLANAIADALIADQDERVADLRRLRENALGARVDQLKAAASAAHARLSALGTVGGDAAPIVALATNRRIEAQGRLDAVRAIIASGSPPLGDRKDLPASIATLEKTYLDLSAQLLKARESLGDRHITIISLKDGVTRASANLIAEWKRIERMARGELEAAREEEASVRKANPPVDASRQEAIDSARAAAQQAYERVTRAEVTLYDTIDDGASYKCFSRAMVPVDAIGFSQTARAMIAIGASFTMLALLLIASRIRQRAKRVDLDTANIPTENANLSLADQDQADRSTINDMAPPRDVQAPALPRMRRSRRRVSHVKKAMESILKALETVDPGYGVPTLMIAANESDMESRPVAIDLAYAIATSGRRVLLIEGPRSEPELAANADPDAPPILVDLFGTLRVMFRSDAEQGILYVAPCFKNEARIASVLARDEDMPMVDEIAEEFDILVFDGGRAGSIDIGADLYLRVGRIKSAHADAQFLEAFEEPDAVFVGTMIGNVLAPPETADVPAIDAAAVPREPVAIATLPPIRAAVNRSRHIGLARDPIPRRRAGARPS